jgi:hypothetical protein
MAATLTSITRIPYRREAPAASGRFVKKDTLRVRGRHRSTVIAAPTKREFTDQQGAELVRGIGSSTG